MKGTHGPCSQAASLQNLGCTEFKVVEDFQGEGVWDTDNLL